MQRQEQLYGGCVGLLDLAYIDGEKGVFPLENLFENLVQRVDRTVSQYAGKLDLVVSHFEIHDGFPE
ncbi:uncharacterized protein METZ01_LOCUS473778 [marine metagenome]|uniref:Uncharacterized protein n=1 Tax=marine metagenome TaxID=408172 RepID=A0A383BM01_9ZZZZ